MSVGTCVLSLTRSVLLVSLPLHCCAGVLPIGVLLFPPGIKAPINSTVKVDAIAKEEK